jgi:hypothetical protein
VEALSHLDEPQATIALLHTLGDLGDIQVLPALQRTQAHDHAITLLGSVSEAATEAIDHLQWQNRGSE